MPKDESVPEFAQLHNGMTAKDLKEAISRSGYPFQATTAATLRTRLLHHFYDVNIQEEWEYIDPDSQQARSVDILVDLPVSNPDLRRHRSSVTPLFSRLNLVIECKQSENPYIFFLRDSPPEEAPSFPEMLGPIKETVKVFERNHKGEISDYGTIASVREVLGFYEFDFMLPPLPYAISLAKVLRSKAKIEVTGEETYRALTYPLLKAVDHLKGIVEAGPQSHLQERFIVPIAIARAPMIGSIFSGVGEQKLISLPWVRVTRLEPARDAPSRSGGGNPVRYYDVVHESYLDKYIDILATAFTRIAERIMEHSDELRSGTGSGSSFERTYESLEKLPEDFTENEKQLSSYISAAYPGVSLKEDEDDDRESANKAGRIGWTFPKLRGKGLAPDGDGADGEEEGV
ncbi:hypothetical protein ABZY19_29780 [Streptomyces sp. NPDC006475]|uniref:hypothetical protein n=1 Tax=Streptomyces sp. NPDC006475 TaxID=3155719 RepID=UPI0033AC982C